MSLFHRQPSIAYEPPVKENDELIEAIDNQKQNDDDDWKLQDDLDPAELSKFWDDALAELGPELAEDKTETK
jgi:hypothetical protein